MLWEFTEPSPLFSDFEDVSIRCPNLTCPYYAREPIYETHLATDHLYWKCRDGNTCIHELKILNGMSFEKVQLGIWIITQGANICNGVR